MLITSDSNFACNCVGPQNGEPLCPCEMRKKNIQQKDGRWVQPETDLGEVASPDQKSFLAEWGNG